MTSRTLLATLALLLATAASAQPSAVVSEPVWDVGLFGGGLYAPDYPAAASNHWTGLALPYAYYRGSRVRADQGGFRGRLPLSERLELTVGFGGALPVRSRDNAARQGMPDLGYALEAGPTIGYRLLADDRDSLRLLAQARAVYAVSGDERGYQGIALQPEISWRRRSFLHPDLQLLAGAWMRFGFDGLNERFYTVRPEFVRTDRPAYAAHNGYQQSAISLGLRHRINDDLNVFAGGQLQINGGSANEDSPLYRRDFNYSIGVAVQYRLLHSRKTTADQD